MQYLKILNTFGESAVVQPCSVQRTSLSAIVLCVCTSVSCCKFVVLYTQL